MSVIAALVTLVLVGWLTWDMGAAGNTIALLAAVVAWWWVGERWPKTDED